jgi:uncharacterized protein YcaQ
VTELPQLRKRAVAHTLFPPLTLDRAIGRLGFVQADPIRAPARAQDLILRPRVHGYRAGQLEHAYASLAVEEDLLHAYGFMARPLWRLIHPRRVARLSALERRVFDVVREHGATHPAELERELGGGRVVNAWGGLSKATTAALDRLHGRGWLRVVRRVKGVRIYEVAAPPESVRPAGERLAGLALAIAQLLAPVREATLRAILARLRARIAGAPDHVSVLAQLERAGALERYRVDGVPHLAPPSTSGADEPSEVRLLAPFDPLVWDRRRFEHLFRWSYRFEAYTPAKRRVRGYYALPLLWRERVIGWANARVDERAQLDVETGFVAGRPRERTFSSELDAEVARLAAFLGARR